MTSSRAPGELAIDVHRDLAALAALAPELRALDAAARRPSLFTDPAYLARVATHDEFAVPGTEPLLLVARERGSAIGFLALRRRPQRVLGRTRTILEHLVTHDTERPGLVAREDDAPRVAAALWRHLASREPGWTFAELKEQEEGSPLWCAGAALDPRRFAVRSYPNNPAAVIPLPPAGFDAWWGALKKDHRRKVRGWLGRLAARGPLELVGTTDPAGALALLDLYLALEARSWKEAARAGVRRDPRRVALFRALLGGTDPATPLVRLVLCAGVPVAGDLSLLRGGVLHQLEVTYDDAYRDEGPGNVHYLLALRDAFRRGVREVNLLTNYAYYKARWGAAVTETRAIQVYRRGSLHDLRARLGALRRRLAPPAAAAEARNPARAAEPAEAGPAAAADRTAARDQASAVLASLAARGVAVERLAAQALLAGTAADPARKVA